MTSRMRLIDLSVVITPNELDPNIGEMEYWKHETGAERIGRAVARIVEDATEEGQTPRRVDAGSFPDGLFLSNEYIRLAVHAGTHLDAPYHYGPECEGEPAKRITDIPLEWCWGDGVVLRFRDKWPGGVITREDVQRELERIQYQIKPFDIVLIETGSDKLWPDPAYFNAHPAMSVEATRFLVEQGVKVIGIDTNGFDLPTEYMARAFARTGDARHLWPCHMYGREKEYLQIERMGGLDQLPVPHGFQVACFPIRVEGAGAGWTRPVAFVHDDGSGAIDSQAQS